MNKAKQSILVFSYFSVFEMQELAPFGFNWLARKKKVIHMR